MRVAVDVTPLVGPRTGVGRFVASLLPALDARADVEVAPYVLSRRAASLPDAAARVLVPAGVALRVWGRRGPTLTQLLPHADVIHGTNQIAPPTAHTVITVHDCSFVTMRELCSPTVVAFGPVVRRVAASGGWIHTPSEHVAVQARALFETDRVIAVPHGPPPSSSLAPQPRTRTILAVGTLEPRKNVTRLVHAFRAVAAGDPEVMLVIAGADGTDGAHVRAAIGALDDKARRRVRVTGWIGDAERDQLLATASVLAYPSLDEGFGLPMLEAWQHEVPVVAARAGALPEVAGDAAVLVDPLDVDALAGALRRALDDEDERARLVARGRIRLASYSWRATADGLTAIYRRAMEDVPW
ncbi:MAG TPA: glycosyltransferase family 1 protein [Acidimicrobiales bacterium]|nr:glycosyltransferase family 1 protein [Acidimicrobiales bacterium]